MSRFTLSSALLLTVFLTPSAKADWYALYNEREATLEIYAGEDGVDNIEVRHVGDTVSVFNYIVTGVRAGFVFDTNEHPIESIKFEGEDERDIFVNNTFLTSHIYGNGGDDSLTGGFRTDFIYGGEGIDSLFGRHGSDYLDPGYDFVEAEVYGGEEMTRSSPTHSHGEVRTAQRRSIKRPR